MIKSTSAGLVGLSALVTALLLQPTAGVSQSPPASEQLRYEDTVKQRWRKGCVSDTCEFGTIYERAFRTPEAVDRVDVVVSVTMDFRTSRGDYGTLSMSPMEPTFRVDSPSPRMKTSTTIQWHAQNVSARGGDFQVMLFVEGKDGSDNDGRRGWIRGRKLTVVVDMRPSD